MERVSVVCIPFEKLTDETHDLSRELWQGFGPDGLGIITVSGVPHYQRLREQLLPLAQAFADLPAHVRAAHEHAGSSYNVGWSHGKEMLLNGQLDTHKGSFYANPMQDTYDVDAATAARHPTYYSPNLWPQQELPQLEPSFKALGQLIVQVGLKLAGHCSRYVVRQLANATGEPLSEQELAGLDFEAQLARSATHKARLLHYFPHDQQQQQQAQEQQEQQQAHEEQQQEGQRQERAEDWCGWHLDHGALTGLACAMYIRDGQEVPNPDPEAGLFICDRSGRIVQAAIPPGHLAFQLGQVTAIQSGGLLRATPHCVRAARRGGPGISRNTFAVFMQPPLEQPLDAPPGSAVLGGLLGLSADCGWWSPGMSFGDFAEQTLRGYYNHVQPPSAAAAAPAAAAAADGGDGADAPGAGSGDQARPRGGGAGAGVLAAVAGAAAAKDVAPAAVHAAAAAAGRQFASAHVVVLHD